MNSIKISPQQQKERTINLCMNLTENQRIRIESGIEHFAMLIMKSEDRATTEGIELQLQ